MANFFKRVNESRSPMGQPQHSDCYVSAEGIPYYSVDPSKPKFMAGWNWYPGVRYATALGMHNHVPLANVSPANLNLVPPSFAPFAVQANRSVAMGARANAATGYPQLAQRVIMPRVSLR